MKKTTMSKKKFRSDSTNRNAIIRTRTDRVGKLRTETARRDAYTTNFAASTAKNTNRTRLFVDLPEGTTITLSGSEARTLYNLLQKHYAVAGKTWLDLPSTSSADDYRNVVVGHRSSNKGNK